MEENIELSIVKTSEECCRHPYFMDNNCLQCNASMSDCGVTPATTLPFRYIHPSLALTLDEVTRVRNDNMQHLFNRKKLQLVLDLDHTLIHATKKSFKKSFKNNDDDVSEFRLLNDDEYVVKLRPGAREFLSQVRTMFDLSICTMGRREYAHKVVEKLGGLSMFSWVISREDCVKAKKKELDVVLSHERVTLIVDDTKCVWDKSCRDNLIRINRFDYDFFPIIRQQGRNKMRMRMDGELVRVLDVLKEVYNAFYCVGDDNEKEDYYSVKDVREELKKVLASRVSSVCSSQDQEKHQKVVELCNTKRLKIKCNGVISESIHYDVKTTKVVLDSMSHEELHHDDDDDQDRKAVVESEEGSVATSKLKRLRVRLNGVLVQHKCTPAIKRRKTTTQVVINNNTALLTQSS